MTGIIAGALAAMLAMGVMATSGRSRRPFDPAPGWLVPGVVAHRAPRAWWAPVVRWSLHVWLWTTLLGLLWVTAPTPAP